MKAVRTAVMIVGAVASIAAVIPGPHQPIAAMVAAGASVASTGLQMAAPKPPRGGSQIEHKADPNAGIPYHIGRTFNGGLIVHRDTWGADNQNQGFITVWSGGGPIDGIEAVQVDRVSTSFDASTGAVTGGTYASGDGAPFMWLKTQLGAAPEKDALASPVAGFPGWSSASKLSGYAAGAWVLKFDKKGKKFTQGVPAFGIIGRGVKVYDPRLDSTYPGGSGSCRPLQESTYVYSENGPLHALTFALGRWQNGKRVLGVGLPIEAIDVAAYVEAANVADANAMKAGGVVSSTDEKWNVLKLLMQTAAGEPMQLGAKLSCRVEAPRVSLATITSADIIGEASVDATRTRRERVNGIIPRYRSEAHGWEVVPASVIRSSTYFAEDGGKERTKEVEYPLVQNVAQVGKLAAYELTAAREFGPIRLSLKLKWIGYKPGDCLTVNAPEIGLDNRLCTVRSRTLDVETGAVLLELWSETTAKHAYALGTVATAPPTPSLGSGEPAPISAPGVGAWAVVGGALQGPDGAAIPAIVLTGAADMAHADSIVVEIRIPGYGFEWAAIQTAPASAKRIEITTVAPGATYEVAVSYVSRGVTGDRLVLGNVTVGTSKSTTFVGAGALATRDNVYFGSPFLREIDGGDQASLAAFKTIQGTAAAIVGQGSGATASTLSGLNAGEGTKLGGIAAGATVGARAGTNLYRLDGSTVLAQSEIVTGEGIAAGIVGQGSGATASTLAGLNAGEGAKLSGVEATADVTSGIVGAPTITIECDYLGVPLDGQLPKTVGYVFVRQGVTEVAAWSGTQEAGSVDFSVAAGTGHLTINSITTSPARIRLAAVYGTSPARKGDVIIEKHLAQAPASSGGGGGGTGGTSTNDSSIGGVLSTSYTADGSPQGGPLTVTAGSNGTVVLGAPLSFEATHNGNTSVSVEGKWRMRPAGGTWVDVTTPTTLSSSDTPATVFDEGGGIYDRQPGSITVNRTVTGLTNGASYEFGLHLRRTAGTGGASFSGTASAAGS